MRNIPRQVPHPSTGSTSMESSLLGGAAQPLGARYSDLNITRTIDAGEGDSAEFSIIIPSDTVAGQTHRRDRGDDPQ